MPQEDLAGQLPRRPLQLQLQLLSHWTVPGTFDKKRTELESWLSSLGAGIAKSITKKTTHLITTPEDFNAVTTKVASAQKSDVAVVSLQWAEDCESQGTLLPKTGYEYGQQAAQQAAPAPAINGSKKNGASSKANGSQQNASQSQSQASAAPKANGSSKKRTKADDQSDNEADAKPNVKKLKAATGAKGTKKSTGDADDKTDVKKQAAAAAADTKDKTAGGSQVVSKGLNIPLDEGCKVQGTVYIAPDGVIYDASLNQTNATNNNNKFYRVQLVQNGTTYKTWTRWGRVGEWGQCAVLGDGTLNDALSNFDKKFKDKSGLAWANRGDDPKPKNKNTILRGFQALKDLGALFNDPTLADSKYSMTVPAATEHLSNLYYTLIPHAFGRNRPPIIRSGDMLKKEIDLLDSLSDMKVASDLMKVDRKGHDVHPADRQYQGLGMDEMTPIDPKSSEFTLLSEYLQKTRGATHSVNYKVEDIFRIERQGELERFEKSEFSSIKSDRRLLWHGSRVTNYGGILSQGLRIAPPEAPVTGYMFGKGIYLADMSSKSANYCYSGYSGGQALLLLCEAELGDPMQKLTNSRSNAGETARANGMWSTWGQGRTGPSQWKDAGCVNPSLKGIKMVRMIRMHSDTRIVANVQQPDVSVLPGDTNIPNASLQYNEYIAYNLAQVRLRYLFRVKM
ncbi:poly [ADP-ribose] polymerase 2-B [Colletotrichum spaethianum]|uniref:Poly [ADP-ribose] polymerase n=1 Tax=Colletotrichum spaethianum TaxID=700344 RepID=A0AA37NTU1_9PEZI|nr:poly [ADP-ribose] polymerase 2-B [Colletotrichum spaethianum]GKT41302.1 poly [ADP-ribose] polymerase 2-B [Colletotrichum spaethianum]